MERLEMDKCTTTLPSQYEKRLYICISLCNCPSPDNLHVWKYPG